MCPLASSRKGRPCCLAVCQQNWTKKINVSTKKKSCASLSATHQGANRSSAFLPN